MNRIFWVFAITTITFFSCSSNSVEQEKQEGSPFYGAKVSVDENQLPTCDSLSIGQLFYVLSDSQFRFCNTEGYQIIDLQGDAGASGSSCTVKTNTNGSKTISCTDSTTATVTDGISCAVEDNQDGSYDLTCGTTTITLQNGKDGQSCNATSIEQGIQVSCGDFIDTLTNGMNGTLDSTGCYVEDDGHGTLTQNCGGSEVSWYKALCEKIPYDPMKSFCSVDTIVEYCNNETFDPHSQFCFEQDIFEKCNTLNYDPNKEHCVNNAIVAYKVDCSNPENCGSFIDSRDNQTYPWVKIGDQIWMAKNLAWLPNLQSGYSETEARYYVPNYLGIDIATAKSKTEYSTYGVLYNWVAANNSCPAGWHLPSYNAWDSLAVYIGGWPKGATAIKSIKGWPFYSSIVNDDAYRFGGMPAGYYYDNGFGNIGYHGNWWTSTVSINYSMKGRDIRTDYTSNAMTSGDNAMHGGLSVRCIKD